MEAPASELLALEHDVNDSLPPGYAALRRIEVDGKQVLVLPDETFDLWWDRLPDGERTDFLQFYGGSIKIARFCCALELVSTGAIRSSKAIEDAYGIAYGESPDHPKVKRAAMRLWRDPAVEFLLAQQHRRFGKYAAMRIQPATAELVEKMLVAARDAPIAEQEKAVNSATKFLKLVDTRETEASQNRLSKALERAKQEMLNPSNVSVPGPEQLAAWLKIVQGQIGAERLNAIVKSISD